MSAQSAPQLCLPWISSAAGSRARISPARERALALLDAALASGLSLPGCSRKCTRDGSLSRMSPAARRSGSIKSWVGWNTKAGVAYRSRCRRAMSALLIGAKGSLLLATPTATGNQLSPSMSKWRGCRAIQELPTPTASSYGSNRVGAAGRVGPTRESLNTMVRHGRLPTPLARDFRGPSARRDPKSGKALPSALGQSTRCLNPRFIEWMMGFPLGWTAIHDCAPSATPSSRKSRK